MRVTPASIPDVLIIEPDVFGDERGFFQESYHARRYAEDAGITLPFVQDNHSRSGYGVLRGLHFQKTKPQGKLIRVIHGHIFDVAVDIRPQSPTFGQWCAQELDGERFTQLWIPPGFAHGFQVLSERADVEYKCTEFYDPADEGIIRYDDPQLAIQWPACAALSLSAKDAAAPTFAQFCETLAP